MDTLPYDILLCILGFTDLLDILRLLLVSRFFRSFLFNNAFNVKRAGDRITFVLHCDETTTRVLHFSNQHVSLKSFRGSRVLPDERKQSVTVGPPQEKCADLL